MIKISLKKINILFEEFQKSSIGKFIIEKVFFRKKSFYSILSSFGLILVAQLSTYNNVIQWVDKVDTQMENAEGWSYLGWLFLSFVVPEGNLILIIVLIIIIIGTWVIRYRELNQIKLEKKQFKPSSQWAKDRIELSLKSIGNRYITYNKKEFEQLNQQIEIQNFFQYLNTNISFSVDDFLDFGAIDNLEFLNKHYKEFQSVFKRYTGEFAEKVLSNISSCKNNVDVEYYKFFYKYRTDLILIDDSVNIIQDLSNTIQDGITNNKLRLFQSDFFDLLNKVEKIAFTSNMLYNREEVKKFIAKNDYGFRYLGTFHSFYQKYLLVFKRFFINKQMNTDQFAHNINVENELSTFLFKHTLIVGEAMSGKTHMLSDIAKKRIDDNKPTILIYAQKFEGKDRPVQQIIKQLQLNHYQYEDEEFLNMLDSWGKDNNKLVFLIIDAINETPDKTVWKNHFIEFVSTIKKYPYIALLMSIRDIEKKVIFRQDIQNFIQSEMIEIEHPGFKEIEYPVLKKFCEVFDVELPNFPLTSPIFANPGLMFLFFETLKRNNIRVIDEQVLKPNFIIEEYIKDRNQHFKDINHILDRGTYIHRGTDIVASKIASTNFTEKVKYDNVSNKIAQIHNNLLEYLISEGIFLEEINSLDEVYLYFSYQKFGNYFMALYLLPVNKEENRKLIYRLFRNYSEHQALIEALIIRYSESERKDFIDIFPELFGNPKLNSIRYKCFAQALRLPNSIEEKMYHFIDLEFEEKYEALELLLNFSFEAKNMLNVKKVLHPILLSLSLVERDFHWSLYIHESFSDKGIVKHIINWAWNKEEKYELEDESLYLYGLTLGWFLTSSNRELRDGTTKALVNLFTDRVDIFLSVLQSFEPVNDLYVLERLYSVSYGIVLRSKNQNGFREIGIYTYETIFNQDEVVEHILLRDYAKLTIESIDSVIGLGLDMNKVLPTYGSSMPSSFPLLEEIEKYQELENSGSGLSNIISSMRTEQLARYGDFGRYTFQSALQYFDKDDFLDIQLLSNYAVKIIKDEYIDNLELFSKIENLLHTGSTSRYDHKVERIGKKYQWLAMYKILSMVADNYRVKNSVSWETKYIKYNGVSELSIRDIDPTTILKEKKKSDKLWWLKINNDFENLIISDNEKWLESKEKLPSILEIINIENQENQFLALDLFLTKHGNKKLEHYRYLRYTITSYIVKKDDFEETLLWIQKQNFYKSKISEPQSFYNNTHLREYPNSQAYNKIDIDYYGQLDWDDRCDGDIESLPHKILLTSTSHLKERGTYDVSLMDNISISLPNKWFINEMKLKQSLNDGEWMNEQSEIVFFDPTVNSCCSHEFGDSGVLLANKKLLLNWLDSQGYTILWILSGEKDIRNVDKSKFKDTKFIGYGGVSGYAYFEGNEFIENIDLKIERPIGWIHDK